MSGEEPGRREYVTCLLLEVEGILRRPEELVQGNLRYVEGWVEEDGAGFRVVYDRESPDRRFGHRVAVGEVPSGDLDPSGEDAITVAAYVICESLDEPLGRFWDLLVEEDGVWWWGDGYPGLDQHPDHPQLEAYMAAVLEHHLNGGPRPAFPFVDESRPEGAYAVLPRRTDVHPDLAD